MFGQILAKLRKERNLSQYKLAELMNFSRGQIANYEQGTREPDFKTLERFANFFNVSTDFLLGRTDALDSLDNALSDMKNQRSNMQEVFEFLKASNEQVDDILMLIKDIDDTIKSIEELKENIQNFNNSLAKSDNEEADKK
ncbi:helix-turn-helix domain-containing protein [Bacillus ndiopicus]|uniref:helix-turn-helix domain-containing protein n=1 Tax=Bacillus ndiopicus TaxID=1347368 RepID=UPI0005A71840|nr:helix-turn-helix domain-containing protein [Bacillus ndiopicus]